MNRILTLILIVLIFGVGVPAVAAIHHVDSVGTNPVSPYLTWETAATNLQEGINSASAGDDVLVSNGTYVLFNTVLITNDISLQGFGSASAVIVDGRGSNRCFILNSPGIEVRDLTIRNGVTTGEGGGIYAGVGGLIRNCLIVGNSAAREGGGICCSRGTVVSNCTISGNSSVTYGGGGVSCGFGAGVYNCAIINNVASNVADGGGVRSVSGGIIRGCVITGNTARVGGGIQALFHATVENCLVTGNSAQQGGGISLSQYTTIQNCTVSDNSALVGGGVDGEYGGSVRNAIVWMNSAATGSNCFNQGSADNYPSYSYSCTGPAAAGDGNIGSDPLYQNRAAGNYRLQSASSCVDSGTSEGAPNDDLDGVSRPQDGDSSGAAAMDMGAYELQP